jgi:hypothetical protein
VIDEQLWKFHLANEDMARRSLKAWLERKVLEENSLDRVENQFDVAKQRGKIEILRVLLRELDMKK